MKTLLNNLNIPYNNIEYYAQALTHPSYAHESKTKIEDNQRLEFLGDAVFDLVISEYLYMNMHIDEGKMTKIRAAYVCEKALSIYADDLGMKPYIYVGNGELSLKTALVADAFEAFVAAIYLDCGLQAVQDFFDKYIRVYIDEKRFEYEDYKSKLQEYAQSDKRTISYQVVSQSGPSHMPVFDVAVYVDDILFGTGSGNSKKRAEQLAAKSALEKMA